mgnify:CR=1 FL=1
MSSTILHTKAPSGTSGEPADKNPFLMALGERVRSAGAIGILVTHSLEAAATADRVLRLDARGLHG